MNFWFLLQLFVDVVLFIFILFLGLRLNRPVKDDPRMSRGLQLLQTKISVLEDLSDKTEEQVGQMTGLMENKIKELQRKIIESEKQMSAIQQAIKKGEEVTQIFEGQTPHQQIVNRQNSLKYINAARLAHQGASLEEIEKQIDLSRGEIEFIINVNRNHLQFAEEELPEWARKDKMTMSELGNRFRKAIPGMVPSKDSSRPFSEPLSAASLSTKLAREEVKDEKLSKEIKPTTEVAVARESSPASRSESFFELASNSKGQTVQIKKMVFPKVNS